MNLKIRAEIAILTLVFIAITSFSCQADTFHYSLDSIVGQHTFFTFPSSRLDLGQQFSHIDSITISFTGNSNLIGYDGVDPRYEVGVGLSVYPHYPSGEGQLSIGATTWDLWRDASFNVSSTMLNKDLFTEFMEIACTRPVYYYSWMQANDGSTRNLGYWEITSASLDISGTPVPEPSGTTSVLIPLGILGHCLFKRRWKMRKTIMSDEDK